LSKRKPTTNSRTLNSSNSNYRNYNKVGQPNEGLAFLETILIAMSFKTKFITCASLTAIVIFALWFSFKFLFIFGEGVKAGELNRIVRKGYIFKTYEGRVIQAGFSTRDTKIIQSNEFVFSVKDKRVADSLMYHCSGRTVELHYKEYKGALPWRGQEKFIVDKIISVR